MPSDAEHAMKRAAQLSTIETILDRAPGLRERLARNWAWQGGEIDRLLAGWHREPADVLLDLAVDMLGAQNSDLLREGRP